MSASTESTEAGGLTRRTLIFYALPTIGMTTMHWLIMVFLLKFATGTLGLAPAVVGVLFAAGRLWDAVTDPLAGWFSDRTRTRLGRRRPWMLAAALPLGVSFYAIWNAPIDASPELTAVWLAGSLLLFFTAQTSVRIPYLSLGAELTDDHHARTRISAFRVGGEAAGIFLALGGLHLIENADSIHEMAGVIAGVVSVAVVSLVVISAWSLSERLGQTAKAAPDPFVAIRDVVRNPHARRLTLAIMFTEVGLGSLLVTIPFATEAFGGSGTSAPRVLGFVIPFILSVPIWIRLGRRFGKSRCYSAGNALAAASFVALGLLGFNGNWLLSALPLLVVGFSQASLRTFPDSIMADVIDWDEAETGQRKEGSYMAAWNLAEKAAGVISVGMVGLFLQGEGGAVDLEGVVFVLSWMPATFMVLAMVSLFGFRLDESAHLKLRERVGRAAPAGDAPQTGGRRAPGSIQLEHPLDGALEPVGATTLS